MAFKIKPARAATVKLDNVEFVTVWCNSASIEAVAQHFDISKHVVSSKAYSLRAKGVQLPKLRPQLNEVDVLNKIIKKAGK